MNILDALKKKHGEQIDQEIPLLKTRKQLNMPVNIKLIDQIIRLAAEFSVSRYALVEHLLQVGCFYANKTLKNRNKNKREVLRTHLIDRHLLDSSYYDPEEILRLGEGRYASELLLLSKNLIKQFRNLDRLLSEAKRTGNFQAFYAARTKIIEPALVLADWLSSHPLDEIEDEED